MASLDIAFRLPANADQLIKAMAASMLPRALWPDLYTPATSHADADIVEPHPRTAVESSPPTPKERKPLPELSAIGVRPISPADSLSKAFSQLVAIYADLMDPSFVTARQVAGEVGQITWVPDSFAPAWEGAKGAREHSLLILARKVIHGARSDAVEIVRAGRSTTSSAEAEMHGRLSLRCAIALQFGATYLGPRGAFFLVEALGICLPSILPEARVPEFLSSVIRHRLARPERHSAPRWQHYIDGMLMVANTGHIAWTETHATDLFKA